MSRKGLPVSLNFPDLITSILTLAQLASPETSGNSMITPMEPVRVPGLATISSAATET